MVLAHSKCLRSRIGSFIAIIKTITLKLYLKTKMTCPLSFQMHTWWVEYLCRVVSDGLPVCGCFAFTSEYSSHHLDLYYMANRAVSKQEQTSEY